MLPSRRELFTLPLLGASALLLGPAELQSQDLPTADEGSWTWFPPGAMIFKKTGKETNGSTCWVVGAIDPKAGTPLHKHTHEDEMFYVLNGEFEIDVADQITVGGPGLCLFGPRNVPHRFTNVGTKPGRLLTVFSPAGLENWFQTLGVPVHGPNDQNHTDLATMLPKIQATAADYGITFVGPPKFPHS